MNNRKCGCWKSEHHDREESSHEHARCFISGEEAIKVTMDDFTRSICEVTNLEPYNRVNDVMKTEWNE
ncbi:hypothetical protein D3C80_1690660 [compost metagenome]